MGSSRSTPAVHGEDEVHFSVYIDITDRKQQERELTETNSVLSSVLDNMPSGCWLKMLIEQSRERTTVRTMSLTPTDGLIGGEYAESRRLGRQFAGQLYSYQRKNTFCGRGRWSSLIAESREMLFSSRVGDTLPMERETFGCIGTSQKIGSVSANYVKRWKRRRNSFRPKASMKLPQLRSRLLVRHCRSPQQRQLEERTSEHEPAVRNRCIRGGCRRAPYQRTAGNSR